jgi:hypothetical protein
MLSGDIGIIAYFMSEIIFVLEISKIGTYGHVCPLTGSFIGTILWAIVRLGQVQRLRYGLDDIVTLKANFQNEK